MTSSEALQTKSYSRIVSMVSQSHQSESNMRSDYYDEKQDAKKCVFIFLRNTSQPFVVLQEENSRGMEQQHRKLEN